MATRKLKYRELKEILNNFTPEQLDNDISIYVSSIDEYYEVKRFELNKHTNVIDVGHPVLITK